MSEFWSFCRENKEALLAIGSAVASLLGSLIAFLGVNNRSLRLRLRDAKRDSYSVICPKCKKESPICECSFVMPSGDLDNNLNGIPDSKE